MSPLLRPIDIALRHEMRRRAQLPPRDVLTREDEALLVVRRAELARQQERLGRAIDAARSA